MTLFIKWYLDTLIYTFLLFITIKTYMKSAQKIVNNLINENVFVLKVLIKTEHVIFGLYQFMPKHILHIYTKSLNIPLSFGLTILAYMLNIQYICFNASHYRIINIKDFRYWLCTSIVDCFVTWYPHCTLLYLSYTGYHKLFFFIHIIDIIRQLLSYSLSTMCILYAGYY